MNAAPTVRAVRCRPVLAPMPRPLRTASGSIPRAPLVLIDLDTSAGVVGRAWLFAYTPRTLRALCALLEDLADLVVGKPLAPLDRQTDLTAALRLLGRQGLVGMAVSGLDMALWDAHGQALERPVVDLLGGTARPIRAYDSFGLVDPRADAGLLEASLGAGFRAIKVKAGAGTVKADAAMLGAIREIVGPDVTLLVDLNQSQTAVEAIRRIEAMAPFDIGWIEEPVPAEDLVGHARVRAASPIPVQTGENWWFPADMTRAIAADALDLAMPDLMKIGGITGWLQAMALAEAASVPLSSHLFVEASAHVLAVSPTAHYLEYLDLAHAILAEPLAPVDGTVTPRGPGLGLAWDERAVARYRLA
ncbi:MAG: enolase C-terminal domain-like protein [Pseudomonadota bacterium]